MKPQFAGFESIRRDRLIQDARHDALIASSRSIRDCIDQPTTWREKRRERAPPPDTASLHGCGYR